MSYTPIKKQALSKGFGLIEVLISLQIISIAALAISYSFSYNLRRNSQTEIKSGAIFAAQQILDELRASSIKTLPTSGSDPLTALTVGNRNFVIRTTYCATPNVCSQTNRLINVDVSYQGKSVYAVESVFAQMQ
jgi:prepilin-type N-terminal cleavage/methylation domain-containing protein